MPELDIPEQERVGLALLRNLADEVWHLLVREIERSAGSISGVESLSSSDAKQVMNSVNWMYRVRAFADVSLEEFVSDVCEALLEYNELKPEEVPGLRERLTRVLDIDALNVAAKAAELLVEHERVFCSVRIVTDARPVYGKSVSQPPAALVVTHILKIDYHVAAGQIDEIYIGMGSSDIREFRSVLDRAEEKAKSLQAAFETSRIKFIDPQKD